MALGNLLMTLSDSHRTMLASDGEYAVSSAAVATTATLCQTGALHSMLSSWTATNERAVAQHAAQRMEVEAGAEAAVRRRPAAVATHRAGASAPYARVQRQGRAPHPAEATTTHSHTSSVEVPSDKACTQDPTKIGARSSKTRLIELCGLHGLSGSVSDTRAGLVVILEDHYRESHEGAGVGQAPPRKRARQEAQIEGEGVQEEDIQPGGGAARMSRPRAARARPRDRSEDQGDQGDVEEMEEMKGDDEEDGEEWEVTE